MPKVNDIKEYWKELAKKNGIDDETMKPLLEAMDKDSVRKALTEGFKPLPDYSHDLDEVRDRAKQEEFKRLEDWHKAESTKFDEYSRGIQRLKDYEAKYGTIDKPTMDKVMQQSGLTKEEVIKILNESIAPVLNQRDSAYMDLLEIREEHLGSFKKALDVKAFEAAWKEHPEWGSSMKLAYKEFVEPEAKKIKEKEYQDLAEKRYQEGVRDGFSRRSLPADNASKEFSVMFDRKEDVAKMSEADQERHSREAFFEGMRSGDKQPA